MHKLLSLAVLLLVLVTPAHAQTPFTVALRPLADEKAVFATVESPNVVPARTRIGGTLASLSVRQGDVVKQGQVIAVVGDDKLLLQIGSLDAQIAGLQSEAAQAQVDLTRAETLFRQGAGARVTLEQARTKLDVATSALRARTSERAVAQQNLDEGAVLAPVAGRVIAVPLTKGSVVLNGDTVATVGEQPFMLRLRIPERHALFMKVGDTVRIDAGQLGSARSTSGTITLIYPQIEGGRVVADVRVQDVGDFFVGDRVRVWISAADRPGYVVPGTFVQTRFGLDFVRLRGPNGTIVETPVQRGVAQPSADMPNGLEILSGVQEGDVLVQP
jgi:RND family efflux transporter MFP subunit